MSNTITVEIPFSFKGKTLVPSAIIDLDAMMRRYHEMIPGQELESVYPLLAASIDIDVYSYEYEIMQAGTGVYSKPTGLAEKHLNNTSFDYQRFYKDWLTHKDLTMVQKIAQTRMGVEDLQQQPALRDALLEALALGRKS